ncbi:hypothetical protein ACIBG8_14825 [Nonomuraea sp. NPDC050556]|uniref:hypothetical protein n=1 Tax=Nonomuraea sp. NPDC050556 TaxID=3364369 RepID=UPI0037BA09CB
MEIVSPHDPQARYCRKVGASTTNEWVGYRDHQSETCEPDRPNVIVHVLTQPAPVQDITAVEAIHEGLDNTGLTPVEHLVDSAYVTPDLIHHTTQRWGITLLGPLRADPRGRAGFTKADFHVNWDAHTVTCPNGITSPPWKPTLGTVGPAFPRCFLERTAGPVPTARPAPVMPTAKAAT